MLNFGVYEQIINQAVAEKLDSIDRDAYYVQASQLDKQEAAFHLSAYLTRIVQFVLNEIKDKERPLRQIEIVNKVIRLLIDELEKDSISDQLIDRRGEILEAFFSKRDFPFPNFEKRIREIMPYTRLSQSELFTGNSAGLQMDSEIRKEILSSDEIHWLVSFIKFSGVRIFKKELEEFTESGRKLKIITTTYMGATESKAIEFLAALPNTEVKVSYNLSSERLHAKAYLFLLETGFHTGYIGSSNLSRSALTSGTEWNVKITTREVPQLIDKFSKTFDTHWVDRNFEPYDPERDRPKLVRTLRGTQNDLNGRIISFFDLEPKVFQEEILAKLQAERSVHGRFRNLIVSATGTGKTIVSAFDYKRFTRERPNAKLLYVAHRKEILEQSRASFQQVLKNPNFGELWVGGQEPLSYDHLFASVQTLNNQLEGRNLSPQFFDYIIIDEVHHISAVSYRSIIEHFEPTILLGLTATPERMDGQDILKDFDDTIAAEIRLPEALNAKILSPFQYFALSDSVDISNIEWRNGRYDSTELTKLYTGDDQRVGEIIKNCDTYLTDCFSVKCLGYCVSQKHAEFMANRFVKAGIKADYLVSGNAKDRNAKRAALQSGEINYLFVVDIFNEGVDIPEIDTVLFLRPTESLTVFLQQLGRGLRLSEGKECLTVLDFVGNARSEYDFESKFRALVGKTHTSITTEIENEFPHLPIGCSIVLEKKAKQVILSNIKNATDLRRPKLIQKVQNFKHQSTLPLNLKNFIGFNHFQLKQLYKKGSWKRLCADSGVIQDIIEPNEKELSSWISSRLIQSNSLSYLQFVKKVLLGKINLRKLSGDEKVLLNMLHYDVWRKSGPDLGMESIKESIDTIQRNPIMVEEAIEVVDYLVQHVDVLEKDIDLGFEFPLKVHSRYSRDHVLAAMRMHTFKKASSNREGVAVNKDLNVEALFVTLKKSEKEYSPTTMYEDYALSDEVFHWQSQNSTAPNTPTGQAYINHKRIGRKILLFVREQNKDEYGNTLPFVFLGEAGFIRHQGAKPMSIEWKLEERIPSFILKESRKLAMA